MTDQSDGLSGGVLNEVIYQGEETPLLFRGRVLAGLGLITLAVVAGYFAAVHYFDVPTSFDAEPFRDWVEARGALGPVVFVVAMAASVLFAPIPNVPIFIAAGLAWGPILGTIYSMMGMMLGSFLAFYTARILGRRHIHRLIGRKLTNRLDDLVVSMGGQVVFWARMLPVVNFDWISFLAGVTNIRFLPFFVWSFLGMLTPTTVAVVAGDQLGKDIRVTVAIGAAWMGSVVLSGGYFWWRRRRRRAAGR